MPGRARTIGVGIALLAAYLLVATVTRDLRGDGARPLYDGVIPAPTYRWVDPPAFFAPGNDAPVATTATVELGPNGSEPTGISTPDGQFVANLGAGAIATEAGSQRVEVTVTPVAPADLRLVPAPRRANGNAYRLKMRYEPGGAPVRRLAKAGTLALQVPEVGDSLFTSTRGARWSRIPATPVPPRDLSLSASFDTPGYYLGGTKLPELSVTGRSATSHAWWIGIAVGVLTIGLVVAAVLLGRRRARS